MWESRRFTTLWDSMACYRDSFSFTFLIPRLFLHTVSQHRSIYQSGWCKKRRSRLLFERSSIPISPRSNNRAEVIRGVCHAAGHNVIYIYTWERILFILFLIYLTTFSVAPTHLIDWNGKASDMYLKGSWFEAWSGHRLSWLGFFVVSPFPAVN
jgi:hypothetical protein